MKLIFAMFSIAVISAAVFGQSVPNGSPKATVDLATAEGAKLVGGQWRYSDTRLVEADFHAARPEGQPTGPSVKTYD